MNLTPAQIDVLKRGVLKIVLGPSPTYQGDFRTISGPELKELLDLGLMAMQELKKPWETEGHRLATDIPYINFMCRYHTLPAGREYLENL